MVSKGNQDLLVNIGIVVLVIVVIYVVIIRNPNALNWLKGPGKKTGAAIVGAVGAQAKIYADANPPHECTNVTDGEKEQGGDRREPQIACGFDFLNTEATVYIR